MMIDYCILSWILYLPMMIYQRFFEIVAYDLEECKGCINTLHSSRSYATISRAYGTYLI
jgi:hypothetical protein